VTAERLADGVAVYRDGRTVGAVTGTDAVLWVDGVLLDPARRTRWLFLTGARAVDPRGAVVIAHADARPGVGAAFADQVRIGLGGRDVLLGWVGRGTSGGDAVAWVEDARVLFAGGLVADGRAPDVAHGFPAEWRTATLPRIASFRADVLVPAEGPPLQGDAIDAAIAGTGAYLAALTRSVAGTVAAGRTAKALPRAAADLSPRFGGLAAFADRLPANVARAVDLLTGNAR